MEKHRATFYLIINWGFLIVLGLSLLLHSDIDPDDYPAYISLFPWLIALPAIFSRKIRAAYKKSYIWIQLEKIAPMLTMILAVTLVFSVYVKIWGFYLLLGWTSEGEVVFSSLPVPLYLMPSLLVGWLTINYVWINRADKEVCDVGENSAVGVLGQTVKNLFMTVLFVPLIILSMLFGEGGGGVLVCGSCLILFLANYRHLTFAGDDTTPLD